jgi:hypothetical protein
LSIDGERIPGACYLNFSRHQSAVAGFDKFYRLTLMGLNKKQKKQIETARNKIQKLQVLLKAARNQPDDPAEAPRLEGQIKDLEAEIEKIKSES